jgi:hypothetical protein
MDPVLDAGRAASANPDGKQFSVANVVGLFLTLSLCLMTQPYGGLLHDPPSRSDSGNRFAKVVFLLWRLNPLACAAESLIIIGCLVWTMLSVPHHEQNDMSSSTFFAWCKSCWLDGRMLRELNINATALLLLRGNDCSEYGELSVNRLVSAASREEVNNTNLAVQLDAQ